MNKICRKFFILIFVLGRLCPSYTPVFLGSFVPHLNGGFAPGPQVPDALGLKLRATGSRINYYCILSESGLIFEFWTKIFILLRF